MGKYQQASDRTRRGVDNDYEDNYVYVSNSTFLKNLGTTGYGLFASRTFQPDDVILEYFGKNITLEDSTNKRSHTNYFFEVTKGNKIVRVIDGANKRYASAARYSNSTATWEDPVRNAEFKQFNQKIYLVASKLIQPNQEIISYYGKDTYFIINQ